MYTMILWVDNYNKWRCSRNAAQEGNISISATYVAMLRVPSMKGGFAVFRGMNLPDLFTGIGDPPCLLQQPCRCFRGRIDDVLSRNLRYEAPCAIGYW